MTPLREASGLALANLYEVMKHAEALDSAADDRAALVAACEKSESDLAKATAELEATQDALRRATTDLKAKSGTLGDRRVAHDLDGKIGAAQQEWSELMVKIEQMRRAIKETNASTDSLIRRLRI
jgi:chromosome segregation ATPase